MSTATNSPDTSHKSIPQQITEKTGNPEPSYNQTGDKSMATVIDLVKPDTFTRQRSDISQKPNNNL